jgi:transposase-like protein
MSKAVDHKQLKRAELILKVQSGQMTAKAAARELGVSRKTYYVWERRALAGLMEAVADREGGRPSNPVRAEVEALKKEQERLLLENDLLEMRLGIHKLMNDTDPSAPLKKSKGLKGSKKKA